MRKSSEYTNVVSKEWISSNNYILVAQAETPVLVILMKDGNIFVGLNSRLKPAVEFRTYRRNLPHLELPGSVYSLSFRTADRLTLSDSAKDIFLSTFHFHDKKKYHLHACVIMNDHAHCILQSIEINNNSQARRPAPPSLPVRPYEYYSLAQITHSIKSYSANRIQR